MSTNLLPDTLITAREFVTAVEPEVLAGMLEPEAPDAFRIEETRAAKAAARYGMAPDKDGRLPAWAFEVAVTALR